MSNPGSVTLATDAIANELARQLRAASDEGALPGESVLASGQVPLEDFLTVKQIERLLFLQQLGTIEVDARLTVIAQLRSHVVADGTMATSQKGSVMALLDPVSAGLRSLRVKITTQDRLVDQARADLTTIGLLRVYGLLMPQAHLLIAAYQMQQLATTYWAQRSDLQRRINAQLLTNPDVAPALAIVNAMSAQIRSMSYASQSAAYTIAGLRSADYPATRPALGPRSPEPRRGEGCRRPGGGIPTAGPRLHRALSRVTAARRSQVADEIADDDVAAAAAAAAGRELLALRAELDASGSNGAEIGKLGDRRSNAVLQAALRAAYPGDAVLSEESADDPGRLDRTRVWIVDPLDGTREYGEPGRTDWAVHVALVRNGALEVGVVALPAEGLTLSSARPPSLPPASGPTRMVVSRTRPPAITDEVSRRLGAVLVPMGSAGAKAMSVLLGKADVYLHAGGQYEWDSAAPVAVAIAAGLHASRIDGSPLVYNRYPAWQPDLLICRPELASAVLEAIRKAS